MDMLDGEEELIQIRIEPLHRILIIFFFGTHNMHIYSLTFSFSLYPALLLMKKVDYLIFRVSYVLYQKPNSKPCSNLVERFDHSILHLRIHVSCLTLS